jgi:hypothetical protein
MESSEGHGLTKDCGVRIADMPVGAEWPILFAALAVAFLSTFGCR